MSAERSPGSPVWAKAPYGKDADGDCLLRSSDNVHFMTQRLFLSYGSPVFADMFKRPETEEDTKGDEELAVILLQVAEDSATIRVLLDILTPSGEFPQLKDVELAINVVTACQKYHIGLKRVNAAMQNLLERVEKFKWGQD